MKLKRDKNLTLPAKLCVQATHQQAEVNFDNRVTVGGSVTHTQQVTTVPRVLQQAHDLFSVACFLQIISNQRSQYELCREGGYLILALSLLLLRCYQADPARFLRIPRESTLDALFGTFMLTHGVVQPTSLPTGRLPSWHCCAWCFLWRPARPTARISVELVKRMVIAVKTAAVEQPSAGQTTRSWWTQVHHPKCAGALV